MPITRSVSRCQLTRLTSVLSVFLVALAMSLPAQSQKISGGEFDEMDGAADEVEDLDHLYDQNLSFSYNQHSGNNNNSAMMLGYTYKDHIGKNRHLVKAHFHDYKVGDETHNNYALVAMLGREISQELHGYLLGTYHKDNDNAGYKDRSLLGLGLGYTVLKSEKTHLVTDAGLNYHYDRYTDADPDTEQYIGAGLGAHLTWQILDNLSFTQGAKYLQSLEDTDVFFLHTDTGLTVNITEHYALTLGYKVDYKNFVPDATQEKTDSHFMLSFQVNFGE
jgi:putative salt-induced outer membrane protein